MRVSKRVGCGEWRQGCPQFVEKRWVRCGEESFAFALWFAIVESASLDPQCRSPALQSLLQGRLEDSEQRVLLALLQRKRFSDEEKLSVWNCEQGVDLLRRMMKIAYEYDHLEQLEYYSLQVTALCQRCNVNILHNPQSSAVSPSDDQAQIYIEYTAAGEFLILYPEYTYSSFLVTKCGDVLFKHSLFQRMAEFSKSRALSKDEFGQLEITCDHRLNITDCVFESAQSEGMHIDGVATIRMMLADTPTPASPSSESKCSVCHFLRNEWIVICPKKCHICVACAVRNYCSDMFAFCPHCDSALSQMRLNEISKCRETRELCPSMPTRVTTTKYLHCLICHAEKGSMCATVYNTKIHNCVVCDECWLSTSGKCNACRMDLSPFLKTAIEELKKKRQWEVTINSTKRLGLCIRSICNCSESIQRIPCAHLTRESRVAWNFSEKVLCTDCVLQEPFVNPCQTCHNYALIGCTRCNEKISFDPKGVKVEGLCEGGCVLCLICMKQGFFTGWDCLFCKGNCKLKDPEHIAEKREQLGLFCCTQSKMEILARCECRRIVHERCKTCYFCKAEKPSIAK